MPLPVRSAPDATPTTYAHPPLVESWLEVDFAQGVQLTDADSRKLRDALGPEWPEGWTETGHHSEWQLTNVMNDRALHLTSQRLAFGWLGYSGERYPRYESVRDGFVVVLDAVRKLATEQKKSLVPRAWSVRYVNRIPRGTVWSSAGEWDFFSLWQSDAVKSLGIDPEGFQARWNLPLEADRGLLVVEFRHVAGDSSEELDNVWITLTTSGPLDDLDASLFDGLDYGREVIVRSFNELVSTDAKTYWGVGER